MLQAYPAQWHASGAVEHDLQRASIAQFWAATCVDKAVLAAVLNLQFHFCRRFCQLQLHAVGFSGRKRFGHFVYLQKSVAVQADQIYCGRLAVSAAVIVSV